MLNTDNNIAPVLRNLFRTVPYLIMVHTRRENFHHEFGDRISLVLFPQLRRGLVTILLDYELRSIVL